MSLKRPFVPKSDVKQCNDLLLHNANWLVLEQSEPAFFHRSTIFRRGYAFHGYKIHMGNLY